MRHLAASLERERQQQRAVHARLAAERRLSIPTPTLTLTLPTPTPAPAPNQMLFVALHGRHDQAVEVATKAVRRDMAIMCHPDKIRRYDSTKVMATAMMQRLGELASK